jgi:hypothetical protein
MKRPNKGGFGRGTRRFTAGEKKPPAKDEKPCLIGNPVDVAKRLIGKNIKTSRDDGANPKRTNPLSVVPTEFGPEDYDPEYTRDFIPTLNDISGMAYCRMLRNGLYREHAAELMGFSPRTVRSWQHRGRNRTVDISEWIESAADLAGDGMDDRQIKKEIGARPEFDKYTRFAIASDRAFAQGERTLFSIIWTAATAGDTDCCQWILERRNPKRWGKAALRKSEDDRHPDSTDDHADPVEGFNTLVSEYLEREREAQVPQADGSGEVS